MLKYAAVVAVALLVTACGKQEPQGPSPEEIDAFVKTESQNAVLGKLKDPKSATFSEVAVHHANGSAMACGKVNSRNSFGGFAGAQRFVSSGAPDATFLEEEMLPGTMDAVWAKFC